MRDFAIGLIYSGVCLIIYILFYDIISNFIEKSTNISGIQAVALTVSSTLTLIGILILVFEIIKDKLLRHH